MAFALTSTFGQSSKADLKAEKAAGLLVKYNKAIAAIDAKDFVIVVDSYRSNYNGATYFTMDRTNFFSYEKQFAYVQGAIFFGEVYPDNHKLEVSEFSKVTDSKGNITVKMFVRGTLAKARVEIFLKKGDNTAEVIYTMRGSALRYTGEVVPTSESNYFKRVNKV
jgi:hypothetical protein